MRALRLVPIFALGAGVFGCGVDEGRTAWAEGRWDAAHADFTARLALPTRATDPALWVAAADAASRAGRHAEASAAARRAVVLLAEGGAAARGGRAAQAWLLAARSVLGAASLRAAQAAERRAMQPEADPATWDEAVALAEAAVQAFGAACALDGEGRLVLQRDLERALLARSRIAQAREAARAARREQNPESEPESEGKVAEDLSPEELARLLEQLDRDRMRPRPVPQSSAGGAVRDW
jgi:hypothetical protein